MCSRTPYIRHTGKENKTKNTTQFLVDTTIHKTQDEDKQNKKTTKYALTTNLHKTKTIKTKTQHNMCLTKLYANKHK
jgi:hypothetical protein